MIDLNEAEQDHPNKSETPHKSVDPKEVSICDIKKDQEEVNLVNLPRTIPLGDKKVFIHSQSLKRMELLMTAKMHDFSRSKSGRWLGYLKDLLLS